jgi:hypothetical protein
MERMETNLRRIGENLVEDSQQGEFSARGAISELFPFVFEASARMSSRAISRWLEANGGKISAATIAKALRNSQPYWEEIFGEIEPAARTFAKAHSADMEDFLLDHDTFSYLCSKSPVHDAMTAELASELNGEYHAAVAVLKEDWYSFSARVREACLGSVDVLTEKETDGSEQGESEK